MIKNYYFYACILVAIIQATYASIDSIKPEQIAIIGTGYVGLVSGTCFAELGHNVICVDIDHKKIRGLQNNIVPIYEPGLAELIQKNVAEKRLHFTTDLVAAIQKSNVIFIAVGTPTDSTTGNADLTIFTKTIHDIASYLDTYKIIVIKSTVPIGTGQWVCHELINTCNIPSDHFDILSNPEFLREGSAVSDFMHPDRIIIGYANHQALNVIKNIYRTFQENNVPLIACDSCTAEAIKYASNTFLAMKISFINEIANICGITGSNIKMVARGIGLDPRIGHHFLNPGPGFGGCCLPKDTQALACLAKKLNIKTPLIDAILTSNSLQQKKAYELTVQTLQGSVTEKTIAILGLAFKANTDDIRDSSAIPIIQLLLENGAHIKAYDPKAMHHMSFIYPNITYCSSYMEAIKDADAMIILTEWKEFETIDLTEIILCMKSPNIIDMRGILDKAESTRLGFTYLGIK